MVNEFAQLLISNGAASASATLAAVAIAKLQNGDPLTEFEQRLIEQVRPAINNNPTLKAIVQPSS